MAPVPSSPESPRSHALLFSDNPLEKDQIAEWTKFYLENCGFRETTDQDAYVEMLHETAGMNPVLAVLNNESETIPTDGWLINARAIPGYGGIINIYRYPEGSFKVEGLQDDREQRSQVVLYYQLDSYGQHILAYENPNYPTKGTESYDRMRSSFCAPISFAIDDIIPLENGGRLLNQSKSMRMHDGSYYGLMCMLLPAEETNKKEVEINRAIGGIEEVGIALVQLGAGMGLEKNDIQSLVKATAQKVGHVA